MAKLAIGNGKVVLLDDKDLKKVAGRKWRFERDAVKGNKTNPKTGKRTRIFMRDVITGNEGGKVICKNGNSLDLRKDNLEVVKATVKKKAPAKKEPTAPKGPKAPVAKGPKKAPSPKK